MRQLAPARRTHTYAYYIRAVIHETEGFLIAAVSERIIELSSLLCAGARVEKVFT